MTVIFTDISGKHVTQVTSCGWYYNIFQNCPEISVNITVIPVENWKKANVVRISLVENILIECYFCQTFPRFCTQLKILISRPLPHALYNFIQLSIPKEVKREKQNLWENNFILKKHITNEGTIFTVRKMTSNVMTSYQERMQTTVHFSSKHLIPCKRE